MLMHFIYIYVCLIRLHCPLCTNIPREILCFGSFTSFPLYRGILVVLYPAVMILVIGSSPG